MICGIVLYNPNENRLRRNIKYFKDKGISLAFYNNGCSKDCLNYIYSIKNACVIGRGVNVGIAKALNEIFSYARQHEEQWVLTFDQDTVVEDLFVEEIEKRILSAGQSIAVIAPLVLDKRRIFPANKIVKYTDNDEFIKMCITSGSCTRVSAWEEVGHFDEYLFIDLVDNDFCKRLILNNWQILRMSDVFIDQEYGNIVPKNKRISRVIAYICKNVLGDTQISVVFSKLAYKKVVSSLRIYYSNRNVLYLNKKFVNYGGIGYESYSCKNYLEFIILFNLSAFLRGKNKKEILRMIKKGICEGKAATPEPFVSNCGDLR